MAKVNVTSDKKENIYVGSVVFRANGSFNITIKTVTMQVIHRRFFQNDSQI